MHFTTLHGLHCIQWRCMESTAFNRDALGHASWNPLHSIILHGIHCTPSCCIKSTAFNRVPFLHTAGNTMHSIGMHFNTLHGLHCCIMDYTAAIMLHIIHCIQSGWFGPCCIKSTAFHRDALGLAAWTPLHTIGIHCATMHGIFCIHWCCMESTAFNWDALGHAAYNPLPSIGMHLASLHWLNCIQ